MSRNDFRDIGLEWGPAITLADFAKETKKQGLFLSEALRNVLLTYNIDSEDPYSIPSFHLPEPGIMADDDKHFRFCIDDILFRMKHYGTLTVGSLESMRNEYVSTLLACGYAYCSQN